MKNVDHRPLVYLQLVLLLVGCIAAFAFGGFALPAVAATIGLTLIVIVDLRDAHKHPERQHRSDANTPPTPKPGSGARTAHTAKPARAIPVTATGAHAQKVTVQENRAATHASARHAAGVRASTNDHPRDTPTRVVVSQDTAPSAREPIPRHAASARSYDRDGEQGTRTHMSQNSAGAASEGSGLTVPLPETSTTSFVEQEGSSDEARTSADLAPSSVPAEPVHLPEDVSLAAEQEGTLDFAALSDALLDAENPIAQLKRFVGDIRTREADTSMLPRPCDLERYAARMLDEAGLFSQDVQLPQIKIVRPHSSHMFYLRCTDTRIPYLAKLRIIRLEAALNAIRFACASLHADATLQQAYQLNQGLMRSIVAQAPPIDQPLDLSGVGEWPEGEWTVRYGISQAIETIQLPFRLTARYRTNVADGNVAIEFDVSPAEVFPVSCYIDNLGIVSTTGDMRQKASAEYALRLGLLLAASAFRCSERIHHVWVAGVHETASHRACYFSVDFDRWRFARIELDNIGDLAETYHWFAPVLRYEDGWLRPVKQSFHLEEERFCPARRYLPVSLSSRKLDNHAAQSLGTDHVSGLSIEEADGRALVANAIMLRLAPDDERNATQKNVRTVMDLAADDPDPTVRSAAERVVRGLVEGTLDSDAFVIGEEFVRGDTLTRANDRAKELLMKQRPEDAHRVLQPLLARIDEAGTYRDTPTVAYRYFSSYVERALYNRQQAASDTRQTTMLVPDAYYEAHLLVSVTCLAGGMPEDALKHAQRLVELAPLDARARLHLVKCLEMLERNDEAVAQLVELLGFAHEPQGMGLAYYRMAYFQWTLGNVAAAQACYQCAMHFLPAVVPMMALELSMLYLQNPDAVQTEATEEDIIDTLEAAGIPIAPTPHTSEVFYDCARASLDAEIFPVARTFARLMALFSGDDVITGVLNSLEDEPDRL